MAAEIFQLGFPSGHTLYALIRNSSGQVWYPASEVFEDWGTGSRSHADWDIPLTDKSGGFYTANFPSAIPSNTTVGYRTTIFRQLGAAPASTDQVIGGARIYWSGTSEVAETIEQNVTALANRMFTKLGGSRDDLFIDDIDDTDDKNAVNAKRIYAQVRNEVLIRCLWNNCRKYADLGSVVVGLEMADWNYAFSLPSDTIFVSGQIDEDDRKLNFTYEIRGLYLFTNDYSNSDGDSAYIDYIYLVTDADEYSPGLVEAITTKWAAEMAPIYKPEWTERLKREYEYLVLPNSKAVNQQEQYADDEGSYSWRDARTS